jgi:hypothetical protein
MNRLRTQKTTRKIARRLIAGNYKYLTVIVAEIYLILKSA